MPIQTNNVLPLLQYNISRYRVLKYANLIHNAGKYREGFSQMAGGTILATSGVYILQNTMVGGGGGGKKRGQKREETQ